ncbi:MAG: hypothetical protein JXA14_03330, partial [Anaerolineae bacterium]|nr:hypothetical protein [Anaerolineae bacterium]
DKQQLGDILVAKQLLAYEPQKVDLKRGQIPRGDRTTSAERLLDRFRSGDNDWQGAPTHFGLVVSGEKLVNDPAFRDWLLKTEPEAIGGEMEGAGLYVAARDAKVDWILVKAICDWGDGDKNDEAQPRAARNAAQFVLHVLQLGGWDEPEGSSQQVASSDAIQQDVSIFSEQTGNVTVIGKIVAVSQAINEQVFRRLGLEQRIGFILLALLIIAVGMGGSLLVYFAVRPPPSPKHMSGDFCIAVAAFTEHESSSDSEMGMRFAEDLHIRLTETFQDFDPGLEITVWGPHQVATPRGQTEEDRAETAAQIAEKIEADVLVYGWIDTTGSIWKISPEFYIRARNSYEIAEIAGQYSIGSPIDVVGGRDFGSRDYANRKLLARTQAIANITAGLTYYNAGYLDRQNFQTALTYFQQAEMVEGWEPWEGKQVLYVLAGNAYGKAGDFQLAETYHQKALTADPEYARALVGLAGVYYMRALEPAEESNSLENTDLESLDLSIATYKKAAQSTNRPPLAEIPSKVHFGLGQCYFARGYARAYLEREGIHTHDLYAESFDEFKAVVEEYDSRKDTDKVRVRVIAAESHARLGLIHALLGELQPACDEYRVAVSLWYDNIEKQRDYRQMMQDLSGCEQEGL